MSIALKLTEFADRVSTTALPVNVIASEARDLAIVVGQLEEKHLAYQADMIAEREREIAERDLTIAELRARLDDPAAAGGQ